MSRLLNINPLPRFFHSCHSMSEAESYFRNRSRQLQLDGFSWDGSVMGLLDDPRPNGNAVFEGDSEGWGAVTTLTHKPTGRQFQSVFVFEDYARKGFLSAYIHKMKNTQALPILTAPDCQIEDFLKKRSANYEVAGQFTQTLEYKLISSYYGDRRADRTGLFYMDHIDDGLYILKSLGASETAMRAYCLHPLFQMDDDLRRSFEMDLSEIDREILILALEYRNIANAYLSGRDIESLKDIALSPLNDVNDMLRADKIQNYKDFVRFHRGTHPRAVELEIYFRNWFQKLNLDYSKVISLCEEIDEADATLEQPEDISNIKTKVVCGVQVFLIRDHNGHIQIYLHKRAAELTFFSEMWSCVGGQIDPGMTVRETILNEAKEEADLNLDSRQLIHLKSVTSLSLPKASSTSGPRLFLFPQYILNAHGLSPQIHQARHEVMDHGWFTLEEAIDMHQKALSNNPSANPNRLPDGIAPRVLDVIYELKALQDQGVTDVDSLIRKIGSH